MIKSRLISLASILASDVCALVNAPLAMLRRACDSSEGSSANWMDLISFTATVRLPPTLLVTVTSSGVVLVISPASVPFARRTRSVLFCARAGATLSRPQLIIAAMASIKNRARRPSIRTSIDGCIVSRGIVEMDFLLIAGILNVLEESVKLALPALTTQIGIKMQHGLNTLPGPVQVLLTLGPLFFQSDIVAAPGDVQAGLEEGIPVFFVSCGRALGNLSDTQPTPDAVLAGRFK